MLCCDFSGFFYFQVHGVYQSPTQSPVVSQAPTEALSVGNQPEVEVEPKKSLCERVSAAYGRAVSSNAWRYSIGRISYAARIPIYAVAAVLQTAKTGLKGLLTFFATLITPIAPEKLKPALENMKFEGVAEAASLAVDLIRNMKKSIEATVMAPLREYLSLVGACRLSASLLADLDKYTSTSLFSTTSTNCSQERFYLG